MAGAAPEGVAKDLGNAPTRHWVPDGEAGEGSECTAMQVEGGEGVVVSVCETGLGPVWMGVDPLLGMQGNLALGMGGDPSLGIGVDPPLQSLQQHAAAIWQLSKALENPSQLPPFVSAALMGTSTSSPTGGAASLDPNHSTRSWPPSGVHPQSHPQPPTQAPPSSDSTVTATPSDRHCHSHSHARGDPMQVTRDSTPPSLGVFGIPNSAGAAPEPGPEGGRQTPGATGSGAMSPCASSTPLSPPSAGPSCAGPEEGLSRGVAPGGAGFCRGDSPLEGPGGCSQDSLERMLLGASLGVRQEVQDQCGGGPPSDCAMTEELQKVSPWSARLGCAVT